MSDELLKQLLSCAQLTHSADVSLVTTHVGTEKGMTYAVIMIHWQT